MTHNKGYLHPFHDGSIYEYGVGEEIRTVVELKMCRFSYYIRSIPHWWEKIDDPDAMKEWRKASDNDYFLQDETHMKEEEEYLDLRLFPSLTDHQIDWVLDELSSYAQRIERASGCQPSCFERIWESDKAIPKEIMEQICDQIKTCFLADNLRDCNIRKTKSALDDKAATIHDFIHPYDFPLISNRTLRLEHDENGTKITKAFLSTYISAIPTDFYIPKEISMPIQRLGYINNLPPTPFFAPIATLLDGIIGCFVPLFEQLLTSLHRANHVLLEPRIPLQKHPLRYERGEDPPEEPGQGIGEGTDDEEDAAMWEAWTAAHRQWVQARKVVLPDVPQYGYIDTGKFEIPEENTIKLRGRKIQVAVQLNRVELTPQKPRYQGSPWKCHGSAEDHVVASGIIVLDKENVTEASLDLRMAVTRPLLSYDDPNSACMTYWGMKRGSKLNQHIGSVKMRRGRCIVYPNLYQRQISPFQLIDPSLPGHQTILQLHFIDPDIPVLSSTDIPPQQASWAMEALLDSLDERLPVEIVQKIVDFSIEERWLLPDSDRWHLRSFVEMAQKLDKELLKRFFEETL